MNNKNALIMIPESDSSSNPIESELRNYPSYIEIRKPIKRLFACIINIFPFFSWIQNYPVKEYLVCDLITGFTIAVLQIPQGMAYGLLAGAQPVNGLYVSFFPVIIYIFMGTSRHLSIGEYINS